MKFIPFLNLALFTLITFASAAPALWAKVGGGRRTQDQAAQAADKNYVDGDTLVVRFFDLLFADIDLEADFAAFVQANLPEIEKRHLPSDE